MIEIRPLTDADVETYYALGQQLDRETKFMMLEPGERNWGVEKQREMLNGFLAAPTATLILALEGNRAVGYVGAQGSKFQRNRHSVHISIGVLQEFSGQGIGTRLMLALEDWAKQKDIRRIELTTIVHNVGARHLYTKLGYVDEGVRRHSLRIDGEWIDELAMAKLL